METAAGSEAARAAAIEVISDGCFLVQVGERRIKRTMKPAKLAAFSEFYHAPHVCHITLRQCGTFFHFYM